MGGGKTKGDYAYFVQPKMAAPKATFLGSSTLNSGLPQLARVCDIKFERLKLRCTCFSSYFDIEKKNESPLSQGQSKFAIKAVN